MELAVLHLAHALVLQGEWICFYHFRPLSIIPKMVCLDFRYSGDACDSCSPGYTKSAGLCQKLYINGSWVHDRIPRSAQELNLENQLFEIGYPKSSFPTGSVIAMCGSALLVLVGCTVFLFIWRFRKRTKKKEMYNIHGSQVRNTRSKLDCLHLWQLDSINLCFSCCTHDLEMKKLNQNNLR